jgi:ribonucleoside-diphosphate reductase alpha chain
MNLAAYVLNPFTDEAVFDFSEFTLDVINAIEFLDNVLDLEVQANSSISEKQLESILRLRRVGLGVMGLADALAMQGLQYGSAQETLDFIEHVFMVLRSASYLASSLLARRKGPAPVWQDLSSDEIENILEQGFFATLPKELKSSIIQSKGTRNVTLLSVAPTGSISNLLGVSSGIEPLFNHEYVRRTRINGEDEFVDYVHPGVEESRKAGLPDSLWPTAYEITPIDHVMIQSIAQQYIDQSISKTVNLPKQAAVDDVAFVYSEAWKRGLKGVTVYRDGSREMQVLYNNHKQEKDVCPMCGNGIIYRDGCRECISCSWSVCEA